MSKLWWTLSAYLCMRGRCGWARWDYASSLYETYVVEDPEGGWTAELAVQEDMSYWGD